MDSKDPDFYLNSKQFYHGQHRHFEPYIREREKLESDHFWGACGRNCKHAHYAEQGHDWGAQPLELRVLGKERAKRVLLRLKQKRFTELDKMLAETGQPDP